MRVCSKCSLTKSSEEFAKGNICRRCMSVYHLAWYHKNKHNRIHLRDKNRLESRKRLMKVIVEYLQVHPCVDCGEKDITVLDFDHVRDKTKAISDILRNGSKATLIKEIEKCEIRCANCHRKKTAERGNWYLKNLVKTSLAHSVEQSAYIRKVRGA